MELQELTCHHLQHFTSWYKGYNIHFTKKLERGFAEDSPNYLVNDVYHLDAEYPNRRLDNQRDA